MGKRLAKKVLLIGWDAADWKIINPLLDSGQMPALEKFINQGVMGNIATLDPPLSPMLWTSIATGKRAYQHGILGFTEADTETGNIQPILGSSRKVKAIWNILNQHEIKSNVIGWWPSHPAEPISGVTISNFYQKAVNTIDKPWPMMPGTVHPERLKETLAALRIHPQELTPAHIYPFVPKAHEVDQEKDKRLNVAAKILADCSSIHAAATYVMEHEEWEFMAVYYDAVDHFCHAFMKFHPPQLPGLPDDLFDFYKDVVTSAYKFHDMMFERLLQLAGPETTVILMSDHGFHSDHLRPLSLPKEPAAPALEHRPYGIFCMKGPGIKKDERIYGASLLDVTPTLLTLFGLPVGEDMEGNVLVQAFEESPEIERIPSWEMIPGKSGMHTANAETDPQTNLQILNQLVELGYIEKPDENKEKALKTTLTEAQFNLARAYIDGQKNKEALPILEKLCEENPDESRFTLRLLSCYQAMNRITDCRKLVEKIKGKEKKDLPSLMVLEGNLFLSENKPQQALECFKQAEQKAQNYPNIYLQLGRCYLQLKQWDDAIRSFNKALTIDKDNAHVYHGLSMAFLRKGQYHEAIDHALSAVGLLYHLPFAHYHLGEALAAIKEYEQAAQAFEVCLTMAPNVGKARKWLIEIYEKHLQRPENAKKHYDILSDTSRKTIKVVSGLPRTGTSMMMQMLEKGGMEIFTDNIRKPDKSNPKGFYEHEAVKRIMRDKSWLKDVGKKVVKVVSPLVFHLPPRFHYKIIFMLRDVDEVLASQHKMLETSGKLKPDTYKIGLDEAYRKNLDKFKQWLTENPNAEVLYVNYTEAIQDPINQIERINEFLNGELNTNEMLSVVDIDLYRNKK
jgi:predicted AlkP superfamily phosphohydrolase/phosphomutase/Flp pilus assembly protein TadD